MEENGVLEFKKEQIVKLHDVDLSSAKRNTPATKPRLVKFNEPMTTRSNSMSSAASDMFPEITPEQPITDELLIQKDV